MNDEIDEILTELQSVAVTFEDLPEGDVGIAKARLLALLARERLEEAGDLLARVTPPKGSIGVVSGSMIRSYLSDRIATLQAQVAIEEEK